MTERHPVVFIHGLRLQASSWHQWVKLFEAHGYAAVAPGWPGHVPTVRAARKSPRTRPGFGISEVMEHYAQIAVSFPARPVLIGHGFGGLLALSLAAQIHAAGVIAIDAVPVSPSPEWALIDPVRPDMLTPRPDAHATNSSVGPVLLVVSGKSHRRAADLYASREPPTLVAVTDVVAIPDRGGPSLVIDSRWQAVAESCLSWMDAHEL